jgi:hypothetical protein
MWLEIIGPLTDAHARAARIHPHDCDLISYARLPATHRGGH